MTTLPRHPSSFALLSRLLGPLLLITILVVPAMACGLDSGDDDDAPATLPAASITARPEATASPRSNATPRTAAATPSPTPLSAQEPTSELEPEPPETEPEPPEPGDDLQQLQADLQRTVDAYWMPGSYSFAVTDLQTGETVSVHGEVPRLSGCVINLFLLFLVAQDVAEGRYPLDEVDALVRETTWSSDAVTAWLLYYIAGDGDATEGIRRTAALIERLGLAEVVRLDHPPVFIEDSIGADYDNWVTAEAMNRALAALWSGDLLDGPMRLYLLDVLSEVKLGLNYLTAAVPEGPVSHKNGFFYADTGWVDNDVGIVQLQRGDVTYAYAVSFFSEAVPEEYGDIVLAQQLGGMAYEAMLARYPL